MVSACVHLGLRELVAFVAAFVAGAMNSVAGGGTLLTFPVLIWLGLPSIAANATSTVATVPGSLGGMLGFQREVRLLPPWVFALIVPSVAGGIVGALLLRLTPSQVFDRLVPLLILFATFLFMAQAPVQRKFGLASAHRHNSPIWLTGAMFFQFLVGVYGGYFGAGIGILMLAALGLLGFSDILQMAGFKNLLAIFINGAASLYFVWKGMVVWPEAIVMAIGSACGGVGGAGVARRIGPQAVRRLIIVVGFGMALSLLVKR